MPELRQDPTTGLWTVLSGDRGHRPIRLVTPQLAEVPADRCPFCRGHEHTTLPTLAGVEGPDGWLVRAFPNRYPALRVEGEAWTGEHGLWGQASGVGCHEVIVESPVHDAPLYTQPAQQRLALRVARDRLADLAGDRRLRHLGWFRNSGALAGASQPHPHAQIVGSHVVPTQVATMVERADEHAARTGRSLLGDLLREELKDGARVVHDRDEVVSFCAYAPRFSGEVWIVPRAGGAAFGDASDRLIDAVADHLTAVTAALHAVLQPPAYNVLLVHAPAGQPAFPWHLRVCPRRVALGGYELMSGGTILHTAPEVVAEALRAVR